jgi:hypothetical protein
MGVVVWSVICLGVLGVGLGMFWRMGFVVFCRMLIFMDVLKLVLVTIIVCNAIPDISK